MCINTVISCLKSKVPWKILEWIVLLSLLIVTGLFANEAWVEYVSNSTSVKTYFKAEEEMDLPVIVTCFNPPINPNVRKKYNNASLFDIFGFTNFQSNISIYQEGVFLIGRDFKITFPGLDKNKTEIKSLHTSVSGLCYRISTILRIRVSKAISLNIKWKKNLKFKPNVSFYFTSHQNSYNVIINNVMGKIFFMETSPIGFHAVMLQKSIYKKLDTVSDCNKENTIPMECASKRFVKYFLEVIELIHQIYLLSELWNILMNPHAFQFP